ncbi:MAG TPA: hypothetical protein VH206_07860 [Xanthobacteraceae bacterium]|jgi:hypothetical protein|nr:hypothetical protein [Xanthobacteraceae bacterium]
MARKLLVAFGLVLAAAGSALANGANFAGPGPGITGNDTGGIFPYSPDVAASYRQVAEDYCARWSRIAKVTSVHRKYGDYVAFVCFDRPGFTE